MSQQEEFNENQALEDMAKTIENVRNDAIVPVLTQDDSVVDDDHSNLSDFEKEQVASGWDPKGEKSAAEWQRSESLYKEIKTRGKQIKELTRTIDRMKQFMEKHETVAYEKAKAELEKSRNDAIKNNDAIALHHIDKEMDSLAPPAPLVDLPAAVTDFIDKHGEWYNGSSAEHKKMRAYANRMDRELSLDLGEADDPDTHMQLLEEALLEKFPKYFNAEVVETKSKYSGVEPGSNLGLAKKGKMVYNVNDLSAEQKKVLHDFERANIISKDGKAGTMTREEYIKTLADAGDLK